MRINGQESIAIYAALTARQNATDYAAIWKRYQARGLSAVRFRWDMLHASHYNTAPLYAAGFNDSHIDTVLRRFFNPNT